MLQIKTTEKNTIFLKGMFESKKILAAKAIVNAMKHKPKNNFCGFVILFFFKIWLEDLIRLLQASIISDAKHKSLAVNTSRSGINSHKITIPNIINPIFFSM
ncbi:MAG: hypothetical protein RBR08_06215 [Desulforegulaceae bacterium]|nr:hypothetical protein [Desulforegulaceae bacterium]